MTRTLVCPAGPMVVFAAGLIASLVATGASAQDQPPSSQSYLKVCTPNYPPPCATQPHPRYTPDPLYSEEGRRARIEGSVVLETVVGEDGHTRDIHLVRTLGHGLDEQAITTLKEWTFEPGMSEGKPVPVLIHVSMKFYIRTRK